MSRVTLLFIVASLSYLCLGVTIGFFLTIFSGTIGWFLAMHAHTNLLGWVSMMIFAVAYHVFPRFSGRQLYSDRLANWHLVLSNAGLIGLIIFWPLSKYFYGSVPLQILVTASALLYAMAAYLFVYNIGKTVFGNG